MRLREAVYGDILSFKDRLGQRRIVRVIEVVLTMSDDPETSALQSGLVLKGWDQAREDPAREPVSIAEHDMEDLYRVAGNESLVVLPETIFRDYRIFSGEQIIRMYLASHMTETARKVYGTARWDEKAKVIVIPPNRYKESMTLTSDQHQVTLAFRNKRGSIRTVAFAVIPPEEDDRMGTVRCDFSRNTPQDLIEHLTEHFPAP
jgi:hypothetical protein